MKFNCGPTQCEKLEAEFNRLREVARAARDWHKWFAWFPVRVGKGDCRWLETVERRFPDAQVFRLYGGGGPIEFVFGAPKYRALP